eukprot:m51a1_g1489 hypothetical protein (461) ;mRNA; r:315247-316856
METESTHSEPRPPSTTTGLCSAAAPPGTASTATATVSLPGWIAHDLLALLRSRGPCTLAAAARALADDAAVGLYASRAPSRAAFVAALRDFVTRRAALFDTDDVAHGAGGDDDVVVSVHTCPVAVCAPPAVDCDVSDDVAHAGGGDGTVVSAHTCPTAAAACGEAAGGATSSEIPAGVVGGVWAAVGPQGAGEEEEKEEKEEKEGAMAPAGAEMETPSASAPAPTAAAACDPVGPAPRARPEGAVLVISDDEDGGYSSGDDYDDDVVEYVGAVPDEIVALFAPKKDPAASPASPVSPPTAAAPPPPADADLDLVEVGKDCVGGIEFKRRRVSPPFVPQSRAVPGVQGTWEQQVRRRRDVLSARQDRRMMCPICLRLLVLTRHHMIPKSEHRRFQSQHVRAPLQAVINLCRPCHDDVHTAWPNEVLARYYHNPKLLLSGVRANSDYFNVPAGAPPLDMFNL